ncbi:MAG: hypothetical protein COV52_08460 [Gammaproteobacteria bacterium CG11_big_fil_rev_8_21_14_0_20_46_22]|nr:MAG: hypothetical protein COW05_00930 [Gammaproteobacteria bacterium CG12_big_fil_rev_8_21_14_0_65_46_12]PIR10525.1 MAG: hypothetical protein COV52_08460 [Gammaproteobacteria bacterium CG11_big_fil_rev_8_21_14_0_20_46_22]
MKFKPLFFLGVLLISLKAQAAESLGQVADNFMVPLDFFRRSMTGMGVVLGIFFCFSAVLRFIRYRENPQEQPIGNAIAYLLVGLAFFVLTLSYHYAMMADATFGMRDVVE